MNAKLFAVILSWSILSNASLAASSSEPKVVQKSQPTAVKKLNLNSATSNELINSFKGIGAKRAESIVNYRKENGKFAAIADLAKVKGIGKVFVDKYLAQLKDIFFIE